MSTPERILACTDFSVAARHAVERAALVSRRTGARLDLLHVANVSPLRALRALARQDDDDLPGTLVEAARQRLGRLAARLSRRYGVHAQCHVATGAVVSAIRRQAARDPAGLIVCGATGESVVRRMLLGSTAERLLGRAGCPVLVVKRVPRNHYRKVLVAVDLSPWSLRAIRDARTIAGRTRLVVLHAFEVPFESQMRYASVAETTIQRYRRIERSDALAQLRALGREAGLAPHVPLRALHGNPVQRIVEQEARLDCDLIVVGRRGASAAEELFLGSIAKRVLSASAGDVLVST